MPPPAKAACNRSRQQPEAALPVFVRIYCEYSPLQYPSLTPQICTQHSQMPPQTEERPTLCHRRAEEHHRDQYKRRGTQVRACMSTDAHGLSSCIMYVSSCSCRCFCVCFSISRSIRIGTTCKSKCQYVILVGTIELPRSQSPLLGVYMCERTLYLCK